MQDEVQGVKICRPLPTARGARQRRPCQRQGHAARAKEAHHAGCCKKSYYCKIGETKRQKQAAGQKKGCKKVGGKAPRTRSKKTRAFNRKRQRIVSKTNIRHSQLPTLRRVQGLCPGGRQPRHDRNVFDLSGFLFFQAWALPVGLGYGRGASWVLPFPGCSWKDVSGLVKKGIG